jgi:hypothetical protein
MSTWEDFRWHADFPTPRTGRRRAEGHDHFGLGIEQLAHQDRKALHPAAGGPSVDHEVGPLGVAKGVQTFAERGLDWSLCGSVKKSDPVPLPCRLLCLGDERRGDGC